MIFVLIDHNKKSSEATLVGQISWVTDLQAGYKALGFTLYICILEFSSANFFQKSFQFFKFEVCYFSQ